jgi:hypothetical protein
MTVHRRTFEPQIEVLGALDSWWQRRLEKCLIRHRKLVMVLIDVSDLVRPSQAAVNETEKKTQTL